MNQEELLTQVDVNDNIIGSLPRSRFNEANLIHRSSYLIVLSPQNKLLLQRRPISKKWHPGKWTFSVTGSVLADETYKECIRREIKKAFGKEIRFKELFKYHHFDNVDKAFKMVFIARSDKTEINLDKSHAANYVWVAINKLKKEIEAHPDKYAPPFISGMKVIFKKGLLEPYF
ncbi:TPA: hypothetical protein DIS56_00950 [Candidatus Saccharibacteria bacterium]|nr:hypothetical protein [Candidatus Saccharibacteria bacterium]